MTTSVFFKFLPAHIQKELVANNGLSVSELINANAVLLIDLDDNWHLEFKRKLFPVHFFFQEVYECFRNSGRPNRLLGVAYSQQELDDLLDEYQENSDVGSGLTYIDDENYLHWR
ncbi:MAG: hypothetical protein WCS12_04520 [Acholeplasmataceae bacterium]|jgi:hypothetical protein